MPNEPDSALVPSPEELAGWERPQPSGQSIQEGFKTPSEPYAAEDGSLSGYDLVSRVLDHPNGGVEALFELAAEGETDWLEFKAAMIGRHKDRKNPNEKDADGHWNVAEAVIAMANSRGGAVLIGVDDFGQPVGLESGDPSKIIEKNGLEAFRRMEIHDRLRPPAGDCVWKTGTKGTWKLEAPWPLNQFIVRGTTWREKNIAVILVCPVPPGQCLILTHNGEERLLRRAKGDVGEVVPIRGRRLITDYENERSPVGTDLYRLWNRFLHKAASGISEDEELEGAIERWRTRFLEKCADLLAAFTPLDAIERMDEEGRSDVSAPREAFEPDAEELMPDYLRDPFLENDLDGSENDGEWDDVPDALDEDSFELSARKGGLFSLLAQESRAVVLGEPGGGKTTCLTRLVMDAVTSYEPDGRIALFAPLTLWQVTGDLWSLLRRTTGLSPGQIERLIRQNRCALYLDALNECPDSARQSAVNALRNLLSDYPDLPVVISARSQDATASLRLPTFTVQSLNDSQRCRFLEAYLGDPARASAILANIQDQPGGDVLTSNPLTLRMIVDLVKDGSEMPSTGAMLYRSWIEKWYGRERDKAQAAGVPLPWPIAEARRALAAIAYRARREGLRVSDDEMAIASLRESNISHPTRFLGSMTQSPFLFREEGRVQFRHETFQEYLCAEFLLANPSLLGNFGSDDYETWEMSIAYAAELKDPLPYDLMAAVWKISPWLAAALAKQDDAIPDLPEPLLSLIRWLLVGTIPSLSSPAHDDVRLWYRPNAPLLRAIHTTPQRKQRWHDFEVSRLRATWRPEKALSVIQKAITLDSRWSPMLRQEADFPVRSWKDEAGPEVAIRLLEAGLLVWEDFGERRAEWIKTANPAQAARWVQAGLLAWEDFADRRADWIKKASPDQAASWVQAGHLIREDFSKRVAEWIKTASPAQAANLVQAGLLSWESFARRRDEWVQTASPEEAANLVQAGLLTWGNFAQLRVELIKTADPAQAASWVLAGLLIPEDFGGRRVEWIETASPKHAARLVESGLLTRDDFARRRSKWIEKTNPAQAASLVKAGILKWEDFAKLRVWIKTVSPVHAAKWIHAGLLTWEDFADKELEPSPQDYPNMDQSKQTFPEQIFNFSDTSIFVEHAVNEPIKPQNES